MTTIPTNHGAMTPEAIIDHLTYSSYAHNRDLSPDVSPERWAKLFGPSSAAMERRYQQEQCDKRQRDGEEMMRLMSAGERDRRAREAKP